MSHLYLLGVATLTLTSAGFAGSDTNADLQARLEAAETRINELSVATNNNWLNDTRSDEIRSLVHDVLADADNRASLQGSGSTAGYNGGFTVGSADGNWSLKVNGLLQASWSNVDVEKNNNVGESDGWGFNTPNAWINMSGTVAGDYSYDIRYNWAGSALSSAELDGAVIVTESTRTGNLEWANGSMNVGDGVDLRVGTFKLATSREAMVDDQNLLALDSTARYATGNGISLEYASDQIRIWGQVVNAVGNGAAANDSQYNWNARFEYMVEGTWGQFDAFTSPDGGAEGILLGISYAKQRLNSVNGVETNGNNDTLLTYDVTMQFGGSSLYVVYGDFEDDNATVDASDSNKNTKVIYGMYLNSDWELYGQYEDNNRWTGDAIYSIGVNNYLAGQNCKWTTQVDIDDHDNDGDTTTVTSQLQFYF